MRAIKRLPVLMYHNVSVDQVSATSVTVLQLEKHFCYISDNRYTCVRLKDIANPDFCYPEKPLLLTFDDAYLNNLDLMYPLLVKYRLKAAIMLPVKFIGQTNEWDPEPHLPLMDYKHLREMDPKYIEFGLHSFGHNDYSILSTEELVADISACFLNLYNHNIPFVPVLTYPFGGYPRKQPQKQLFFNTLKDNGIKLGMRIGNRINKLPFVNPYEIKRIDIRGTDSFWRFKAKLRLGWCKFL